MKKLVLVFASLTACATTTPTNPLPTPRQNQIDPTPAVQLLRNTRFEEAEAKAKEILAKEPPNSHANVVAAIVGYKRTLHQVIQDAIAVGMGAFATGQVNQSYLSHALRTVDEGFTSVEKLLAAAGSDSTFSMDLCLACWRYDWNHNGRIDRNDEAFFQIEVDADGERIPRDDPRRKPTFRFDVGDVHWARAMVLFQHAAIDILMAYDLSGFDSIIPTRRNRRESPEAVVLRLVDKARITRAKALLLEGLAAAALSRTLYLAETDDVNEWVPNPRQQQHPLPLPVDEALYTTWGQILGDLTRLVEGKEALDVAELAQLGDHTWSNPPKGYLNLGRLFDAPADIVVNLRSFESLNNGPREQPATVEKILREVFGDTFTPKHTPSPLLGRFRRMKGEIERGQESLERKFRYLLWLN